TSPQHRRLLANCAMARAKLECTTVGAIDVRIGPPGVGSVRHRQIGLQCDFTREAPWSPRHFGYQREAFAKMIHGFLGGRAAERAFARLKPSLDRFRNVA